MLPTAPPPAATRLLLMEAGNEPDDVMAARFRVVHDATFPLLRQTELRRLLTEAQLKELERYCRTTVRRPGTTLFRQGDHADALFLLVEGSVELRAKPPGRRVYRTVEVVRGSCTFGDEALFGEEYLASARVLESAKMLVLTRESFQRLSDNHPDIAAALLRCSGGCLINTLRRSAILTQAPADVALRMLLEELAAAESPNGSGGIGVPLRITHAQLAGVLHLSRETVSRMLSQMAGQGKVELGRGIVKLRSHR